MVDVLYLFQNGRRQFRFYTTLDYLKKRYHTNVKVG